MRCNIGQGCNRDSTKVPTLYQTFSFNNFFSALKLNNTLKLIIAVAISELAGIAGSFFTVSAIPDWYASLEKPALNPPAWI
ncbi:MAG: tryptophan-rich sensory protein, partial [bacterium]|nr:tryptophan-rich sensory protein [bacterium]